MNLFTRDDLDELIRDRTGPCVSLYMPTHRGGTEEDPIRWRKAVHEAEARLQTGGSRSSEARQLLRPCQALLEDAVFWRGLSDGLACFVAPEFFRCYRLPSSFENMVMVARQFHVTPLLPLLCGDGQFYILAVSQNKVRLLFGTRQTVSEIDLKNVPRNLAEAMNFDDNFAPLTFHTRPGGRKGGWAAIFHGQGVGIDDKKNDLLRYFQAIDQGLHEALRDEQAPLIFAGVDYLLPIYREANSYPHLWPEGISGNPDHLSDEELHQQGWSLVQKHFRETQERALAQFCYAAGLGRTTIASAELVPAAVNGQIETLFLARGAKLWGNLFDNKTVVHKEPQTGDEELLNQAATRMLAHRRAVYVLEAEQMPAVSSAAGIYCLPLAKHAKS